MDEPPPDEEMQEFLKLTKRVSRLTGIPVELLEAKLRRMIVAEQLRQEQERERLKGRQGPNRHSD